MDSISLSGRTFLHFALLADAPRVAAHLMKHGANMDQSLGDYPDLTPLCLTISQSQTSSQRDLDSALRIASSYALPRTTRFLLARGADANAMNYGIAALHAALVRRLPWQMLERVRQYNIPHTKMSSFLLHGAEDTEVIRRSMIMQTVSELLKFGAQVQLRTTTSRIHMCNHRCWRSLDCDHRGQTALHLACASGIKEVVFLLFKSGADPSLPNDDGYTPLYYALVQEHGHIAQALLNRIPHTTNPIVFLPHQTTALHVACRYAFSQMVVVLLEGRADANVLDINGRTPLHEVLGQTQPEREKDVITTLNHLDRFEADPNITSNAQSPWQLAQTHPFKQVREMFTWIEERIIPMKASRYIRSSALEEQMLENRSGDNPRVGTKLGSAK